MINTLKRLFARPEPAPTVTGSEAPDTQAMKRSKAREFLKQRGIYRVKGLYGAPPSPG